MSAAFTPGPWYVNGGFIYSQADADAQKAALAADRNCGAVLHALANVRDPANARLIAAAPELYEALDVLADAVGRYQELGPLKGVRNDLSKGHALATAALAKARGL